MDFDDPAVGLYTKYGVYRPAVDPVPEEWHDHSLCDLFMIDLDHDPYADAVFALYKKSWELYYDEPFTGQDSWRVYHLRNAAKHKDCRFLVLDACHDPISMIALRAYRVLCSDSYPLLGNDLEQMIQRHRRKYDGKEKGRWSESQVPQDQDAAPAGGEQGGTADEARE